jgi:hypothetical protein
MDSEETTSSEDTLRLPNRTELARKAFNRGDPTVSQLVHNAKVTREEHKKYVVLVILLTAKGPYRFLEVSRLW